MRSIKINLCLIIATGFTFFLLSCSSPEEDLLLKMARINGDLSPQERVERDEKYKEYKVEVNHYEKIVDDLIEANQQSETFNKLLGLKYIEFGMYAPALGAYERALAITPENANLLYYAALCSARLSKTAGEEINSMDYLGKAERYYKASLAVNPRFSLSLYGLSVLYVYEFSRPGEAIEYLKIYNTIQKSDNRGKFLLAAAYYGIGREQQALAIYDKLVSLSGDKEAEEAARQIRQNIIRGEN